MIGKQNSHMHTIKLVWIRPCNSRTPIKYCVLRGDHRVVKFSFQSELYVHVHTNIMYGLVLELLYISLQ